MFKEFFHKIGEKRKANRERREANRISKRERRERKKLLWEVDTDIILASLNTCLLEAKLVELSDEESRWKCIEKEFKDKLFLSDDGWYWYVWSDRYWLEQADEAGAALRYPVYIAGMANPDVCGETLRIPSQIRLKGITLNVMGVRERFKAKKLRLDYGLSPSENLWFSGLMAQHLEIPDTVVLLSGIDSLPRLRELRLPDNLMWFDGFNNCPVLESVKFGSRPFQIRGSYLSRCPALRRIEIKSLRWILQQKQTEDEIYRYSLEYLIYSDYLSMDQIIETRGNSDSGITLKIDILEDFSTIVFTDDFDEMASIFVLAETAWIGEQIRHIILPRDSHVFLEIDELREDNYILVWQKDAREDMLKNEWKNAVNINLQWLPSLEDVTLPPDTWIYDEIEPEKDDEILKIDGREYVRLTPTNVSRYESRFGCRLIISQKSE